MLPYNKNLCVLFQTGESDQLLPTPPGSPSQVSPSGVQYQGVETAGRGEGVIDFGRSWRVIQITVVSSRFF